MKTLEAIWYTLNLPFTVTSRVRVWHTLAAALLAGFVAGKL